MVNASNDSAIATVLQAGKRAHQQGNLEAAEEFYLRVLAAVGADRLCTATGAKQLTDLGLDFSKASDAQLEASSSSSSSELCEALHLLGASRVQRAVAASSSKNDDDDDDEDESPTNAKKKADPALEKDLKMSLVLLRAALHAEPTSGEPPARQARLRNTVGGTILQARRWGLDEGFDEPLELLRSAVEKDDACVSAWQNLSKALRLGRDAAHDKDRKLEMRIFSEQRVEALRKVAEKRPKQRCIFYNLGMELKSVDKTEDAIECLEKHLKLAEEAEKGTKKDDVDRSKLKTASARHWLAVFRGENTATAPPDYVAALFDGYAHEFDEHLVTKLGYRTPQLIATELEILLADNKKRGSAAVQLPANGFGRCTDLGAGTGLMGPPLRELGLKGPLEGVDLSEGMLKKARDKGEAGGSYNRLICGDLLAAFRPRIDASVEHELAQKVEHLKPLWKDEATKTAVKDAPNDADKFDLIVAADVFVYIGDLSPSLDTSAKWLTPKGLLVFSTETVEEAKIDDDLGYLLTESGRYVHSPAYVQNTAEYYGLSLLSRRSVILRYNGGKPVNGDLYVFRLPDA